MSSLMEEEFDDERAGFQLLTQIDPSVTLQDKIDSLETLLEEKLALLRNIDDFHRTRRGVVVEAIDASTVEIKGLKEMARYRFAKDMIVPSGPACLSCVGAWQFQLLCNAMILGNLAMMIFEHKLPEHIVELSLQAFLVWYVFELMLKVIYYQCYFFCGPVAEVWWSWLDLLVVISGIIEQWLMPLLDSEGFIHHKHHNHPLAFLRYLRLFRLIRFLKLLSMLRHIEPSVVTTKEFEFFMNGVIFINAIVMGLSLDVKWAGWFWVDQVFLLIYIIELYARVKYFACNFFTDPDTYQWNCLDLVIVCTGISDQWLTPIIIVINRFINVEPPTDITGRGNVMQLLRFMRLLRVLRLAKLLKAIPPLHRLLVGVVKALDSMKWVFALTCLILYSVAIVFTTLVRRGVAEGNDGVDDENFNTVTMSIFSLFKLMNGDIHIADNLTSTVLGKLMFVGFMVLANWAILGILSAVLSDNMIRSSIELLQKERAASEEKEKALNRNNLLNVFRELDTDDSGYLDEKEWSAMLSDDGLKSIFLKVGDLRERDLAHLFECLAEEVYDEDGQAFKVLHYGQFLNELDSHEKSVDHHAVMRIMARLARMEKLLLGRYDRPLNEMRSPSKTS